MTCQYYVGGSLNDKIPKRCTLPALADFHIDPACGGYKQLCITIYKLEVYRQIKEALESGDYVALCAIFAVYSGDPAIASLMGDRAGSLSPLPARPLEGRNE